MEEVNQELQERADAFSKELIPLLAKYELGLGAIPFISKEGLLKARLHIFDDRKTEGVKTEEVEPVVA